MFVKKKKKIRKYFYGIATPGSDNCNARSNEVVFPQPKNVFARAAWPVSGVAIAVSFVLTGIDLSDRLYMHYFPYMVCNKSYTGGGVNACITTLYKLNKTSTFHVLGFLVFWINNCGKGDIVLFVKRKR